MMGRDDVRRILPCTNCEKTPGKDPKNRKRKCPECVGSSLLFVCITCNKPMPCPGTRTDCFDQSSCDTEYANRNTEA